MKNGGGIIQYSECTSPAELELILDTQAAHHFNFVSADVETGIHTIKGQTCTATTGSVSVILPLYPSILPNILSVIVWRF